jgi:uncharacterized RDD family membrane protein YckC
MTGGVRYAGLGRRLAALVIDLLLFCAVFFPVTRLVKGVWLMGAADHRWAHGWVVFDPICLIFLVIMFAYAVFLEGLAGATAGKWASGIRVIGPDGRRPGLSRALLRNVLRLVDTLPVLNILGVILILLSPQRARFGDRVAATRVVHVR